MNEYLVHRLDGCDTEAKKITALNASHAAEQWARKEDFEGCEFEVVGGHGQETRIIVCEVHTQTEIEFAVSGRSEPVYTARKVNS